MSWDSLIQSVTAAPGGGLSQPGPTGGVDAAFVVNGLVQRGLPRHVAEGFAMNIGDESQFDPGINEISPTVKGSRGGYGLYQLTGPRRRAYEAFAAQQGRPVNDANLQLDFLVRELQGPEAAAAKAILGTSTAGEAGAAIVNRFLRPAEEHRRRRAAKYLQSGGSSLDYVPPSAAAFDPGRLWLDLGGS